MKYPSSEKKLDPLLNHLITDAQKSRNEILTSRLKIAKNQGKEITPISTGKMV
jgi:hypothetical protein